MLASDTSAKSSLLTVSLSVYPFSIPNRKVLEKIGADPDISVELPAESGGGYEGILGTTHQLHCIVREHSFLASQELYPFFTYSTLRRTCGSTVTMTTILLETLCLMTFQKQYMATLVSKSAGTAQHEKMRNQQDPGMKYLDHCADLLRQNVLCQADVSVITFDLVKGHRWPQPNYGNPNKCRNYEDILVWAERNQAPVPPGNRLGKPDGAMERELTE